MCQLAMDWWGLTRWCDDEGNADDSVSFRMEFCFKRKNSTVQVDYSIVIPLYIQLHRDGHCTSRRCVGVEGEG